MAKRGHVERIELPVERIELPLERISDVPGPVDRSPAAHRVWTAMQRTARVAADERAVSAASPSYANVTFVRGTTFRRLVDVPGARLDTVLRAWWSLARHDDRHLRFDALIRDHDGFELDGWLRISAASRQIPVEVRLSPYRRCWTFLELTPRRATRASRAYFRVGHASLDRFVGALASRASTTRLDLEPRTTGTLRTGDADVSRRGGRPSR